MNTLPADLLNLILNTYVNDLGGKCICRFVCRKWRGLLLHGKLCSDAFTTLNTLIWARKNHCPWSENSLYNACKAGDLSIVKYMKTNSPLWSNEKVSYHVGASGNISALEWAISQGCPLYNGVFVNIVRNRHLHVLEWAKNHYLITTGCMMTEAAAIGWIEGMEWLEKEGIKPGVYIYNAAVQTGQISSLNWAYSKGVRYDSSYVACIAAFWGKLDSLKWLKEHQVPITSEVYIEAAKGGFMYILEWLKDNNIPWDVNFCKQCSRQGSLKILKWARGHGAPWYKEDCLQVSRPYPATHQWILEN